jgi:hypothetical protein
MTKSDVFLDYNRITDIIRDSNIKIEDKNYIYEFLSKLFKAYEDTWDNLLPLINVTDKNIQENIIAKLIFNIGNVLIYKLSLGEWGNLDMLKEKLIDDKVNEEHKKLKEQMIQDSEDPFDNIVYEDFSDFD